MNIIKLLSLTLLASCLSLKSATDTDFLQPCVHGDNDAGYSMIITNRTMKTVNFRVYLTLATYDMNSVEGAITPGNSFLIDSCQVKNRLGAASSGAVGVASKALGKSIEAAAKALEIPLPSGISENLAKFIMDTQGWYPVCFQKVQFDYDLELGNNPYSTRKPITKKMTYEHKFGGIASLGGTGLACNNMSVSIREANGELVFDWPWTNIWERK